jgi:cardiolipin synthase
VLQAVFLIDWYNATGKDIFTADHFPRLDPEVQSLLAEDSAYAPVQILTSGPDSECEPSVSSTSQ